MFITESQRKLYYTVIRKLTFTPCISQSDFIDLLMEQELGSVMHAKLTEKIMIMDNHGYKESYSQEYNRITKKCNRLLSYLTEKSVETKSLSNLISMPKIYDEILIECQMEVYNTLTQYLNGCTYTGVKFPLIEVYYPRDSVIEFLNEQVNNVDIETSKQTLSGAFPYLHFGERDGLTFVECIILANIYLTHHSRSLSFIKSIKTKNANSSAAKEWVKKVTDSIKTDSIRQMCVDVFFDVLSQSACSEYLPNAETFIRGGWLPEKYKHRKDAFNAVNKHGEWQGDEVFVTGELQQQADLWQSLVSTNDLRYIISEIIPLAWDALLQDWDIAKESEIIEEQKEASIKTHNDNAVEECKHIAMLYLREATNAAQNILNQVFTY